MKIIGLCGQSGSGKSTFAACFQKKNIPVLDCDKIYHSLISAPSQCLTAIADRFGRELIVDGALDRKLLGKIVFSNSHLLCELNNITHHFVLEELSNRISDFKEQDRKACVIDAPMLFEAGLENWCDFVCCVVATKELQTDRICKRDHISAEDANLRIHHQLKTDELINKCDYVVYNTGNLSLLDDECENVLKKLNLTL